MDCLIFGRNYKNLNRALTFCFFLVIYSSIFSQSNQSYFELPKNKTKHVVPFRLINNLIIVPIEVNGVELNFILDSGVSNNIIFNLTTDDTVLIYKLKKVKLRGLGSDGPVEAYFSEGNNFSIGGLIGRNQDMFILADQIYDLSTKLGINVHGVIGYELFKEYLVKINYRRKHLTFYKPEAINAEKEFGNYESIPIVLNKRKPYIDAQITINRGSQKIPVHLLVDSGGGDALWLFLDDKKGIDIPNQNYYQYMGMGLSGKIYGSISKLDNLELQSFNFKRPNVSFPDTLSIGNAKNYNRRNGSIGGEILKRFHIVFDYPNRKILLKKNSDYNSPFSYNMSGMTLVYDGKALVKVIKRNSNSAYSESTASQTINFETRYDYEFRPVYKVYEVSPNTPAFRAGIQKDDILLKIGNRLASNLSLKQINGYFQKPKNKISVTLLRGSEQYTTALKLIDVF